MSTACILDALRQCLLKHQLYRADARLIAAVSGGSDSMALLNGLYLLRQEIGFTLHVCHVQHGLRGEDSLADERLVRDYCRTRSIPLTVHNAQLGGDLHLPGMETRARECRRAFFADMMAVQQAHALLLAHHRDDQAETILMHLLRGAGSNGLSGMREAAPFGTGLLLRPFLCLSKLQLTDALAAWSVPYREDLSNQELLNPRNILRLEVLPALEKLSPGCTERMAQAALRLRRDEEALDKQATSIIETCLLQTAAGLHGIDQVRLRQADEAVAIRALRKWYMLGLQRAGLRPQEQSLSAEDSEALLRLALKGEAACVPSERGSPSPVALNLPNGLQAVAGSRWLHLQHQDGKAIVVCPQVEPQTLPDWLASSSLAFHGQLAYAAANEALLPLPGWTQAHPQEAPQLLCTVATPEAPPTSAMMAYVPLEMLHTCTFRTPLPEDTIRPLGAPGQKPLRRYLTDRKIDLPFRPHLPVLASGSTILWIPGLCTAQALAYQPQRPCLCLALTVPPPYLPQQTTKGDERHG